MTEKWADRLISAVRYNTAGTHLSMVRVHVDNGSTVGNASEQSRETVVSAIDGETTYATIYKSSDEDSRWVKGADVFGYTLDGTKYIKTVADTTKKDNLGRLPTFDL